MGVGFVGRFLLLVGAHLVLRVAVPEIGTFPSSNEGSPSTYLTGGRHSCPSSTTSMSYPSSCACLLTARMRILLCQGFESWRVEEGPEGEG